jgi:hypothetical protein
MRSMNYWEYKAHIPLYSNCYLLSIPGFAGSSAPIPRSTDSTPQQRSSYRMAEPGQWNRGFPESTAFEILPSYTPYREDNYWWIIAGQALLVHHLGLRGRECRQQSPRGLWTHLGPALVVNEASSHRNWPIQRFFVVGPYKLLDYSHFARP